MGNSQGIFAKVPKFGVSRAVSLSAPGVPVGLPPSPPLGKCISTRRFRMLVRFKQHSNVNLSGVRILCPSRPLILGLLVYALNFYFILPVKMSGNGELTAFSISLVR